jgi:hypothetical protein
MIALLAIVMMTAPIASAAIDTFTVTPTTTTVAGATSNYTVQLNTSGFNSLNITIPAGLGAVVPAAGESVAIVDMWNGTDLVNFTFTANSSDPSTKVDVRPYDPAPMGTYVKSVDYAAGGVTDMSQGDYMVNLTLPTTGANGTLNISVDGEVEITNMTVTLYLVKNPTTVGTHTFVANATGVTNSTNVNFVPANSTGVVTLNKTSYVSGDAANVTVTDSDANLNSFAVEDLIVNVTSTTNSTNTSITLTETSANSGIFNGTFDFSAVGDAQSGVETTPSSMVAGVATVFKINATDVNGVLDTGFTGTMTISVNGSATATPTSHTFVTADNGTKDVSVTDNVAESIKIDFNSTSFTNATTTETVVPNKPTKLVFNSSMPRSTLTNSLRVNISLTDAYDNPFNASRLGTGTTGNVSSATHLGGTDGLGTGVSLNVTLSLYPKLSSALDTTSIVINDSSVNTYLAYVNDSTDEDVTLHAESNFFTAIQTDLSFLPAVAYMVIDTNKTADTAHANGGANAYGMINITAQLMSGSDVPLAVPGTVVTFTTDNSTVLNSVGTATTNASGTATLTVSTTTTAGTATVGANAPGGIKGLDAPSGNIGLIVTTTPVVDNSSSTLSVAATARAGVNATVSTTIKDYGGATVSGITVSFNITSGDSSSTLDSVAKGTIVTADTNSTGVATVTFRGTNGSDVLHSINATIVDEAGVTQRVGATEQPITVSPNDAAVLVASPTSKGLANILGESVTFNVTAYDNYGNKNTSIGSLKVNVSTTNTALGNMTVGSTTTNNYAVITTASGFGTMVYKVNTTTPGDAILTFAAYTNESGQVAGLVDNITKTVNVTTSGASGVTITPSVPAAAVDTSITLTVNLTDVAGNLIGIDDTSMNLVISAGTASLSDSMLTSSGGQAFANVISATAGDVTVTVYVAGLTSASTTVTFSGNATLLTITPESASVNLSETTNLTIQAYDALGNKAAIYNGAAISTQTGVIPAVTGLTFNVTSFTFNATGCAVVNVTNATSATAGTYTVQAIALGMIGTTDIEFTDVGVPDNKTGDIDGSGTVDFDDALYLARYTIFGAETYPLHADGDIDGDGDVDFDDALYLARYTIFGAGSYPLYP